MFISIETEYIIRQIAPMIRLQKDLRHLGLSSCCSITTNLKYRTR